MCWTSACKWSTYRGSWDWGGEGKAGGTPLLIRIHLGIPVITFSFKPFHACELQIGISSLPHLPYVWGHLSCELGPLSPSLKSKIWNLERKQCVNIMYKSSSSLITNSVSGINKGVCVHMSTCVCVLQVTMSLNSMVHSEWELGKLGTDWGNSEKYAWPHQTQQEPRWWNQS